MTSVDLTLIKLGPGAQILEDAPENKKLLDQIQHTEPATAVDLFKLAQFYRSYSRNKPLADHLALVALRQIIGLPIVLEAMKAAILTSIDSPLDDIWDQWEDSWFGYDPSDPEDIDRPESEPLIQNVPCLWVLGLLIEKNTKVSTSGEKTTHYYVIGVCPEPASLTIDALTQRKL